MDQTTPTPSASTLACPCTPELAWGRVNILIERALAGDRLSRRILAWNVDHAMRLSQAAR